MMRPSAMGARRRSARPTSAHGRGSVLAAKRLPLAAVIGWIGVAHNRGCNDMGNISADMAMLQTMVRDSAMTGH